MSNSRVQVAIRVRPMLAQERSEGCESCIKVLSDRELLVAENKQFSFDHVFKAATDQRIVYDQCVWPLVENLFEGYNVTIFAYGQTGSGKTFTMGSGCETHLIPDQNDVGVIPRAVDHIFDTIAKRRADRSADDGYYLRVQFLELYGEILRDLLDPGGIATGKQMNIRDGENNMVQVIGAIEESVRSREEMLTLLERGSLCRTTASTSMNTHSSRSHAIFTITLEQQLKLLEPNENGTETEFRVSKFHFVDLAGSERVKRTNSTGQRMKEGIGINKGLLALGNVISALGNIEDPTPRFVNYRDSKLTRLLQDSLGGNSRTLMITCISPADINLDETLNALRYANRAKNIQNCAVVNRDSSSSLVVALKAEIARLKAELALVSGEDARKLTAAEYASSNSSAEMFRKMQEQKFSSLLQRLQDESHRRRMLEERLSTLEAERETYVGLTPKIKPEPCRDAQLSWRGQGIRTHSGSTTSFVSLDEPENLGDESHSDDDEDEPAIDQVVDSPGKPHLEEEEESMQELRQRFEQSQKALRALVMRYDETLQSKKCAMAQMEEERTRFEVLKSHFEQKMLEMSQEIRVTKDQREQLQRRLKQFEEQKNQTESSRSAATKIRAQVAEKDSRLRELQDRTRQLQEARRIALEWQQRESQLRGEIQQVYRDKAELQRQIAENHKRHAEELTQRKLEIAGLQRERARLEQDTQVLNSRMARDNKILHLKSEQVAAMQRKLREAQRSLITCNTSAASQDAVSERDKSQRAEIERLAALQVQREEELIGLRRALAKKERAIIRRNRLLSKLQMLKADQDGEQRMSFTPVTIRELVPEEATVDDVVELEQRLEALEAEISFRDEQCQQAMLQPLPNGQGNCRDGEEAEDSSLKKELPSVAAIWSSFNTIDQARDVCRVSMQMFVEAKHELRDTRAQLQHVRAELATKDIATILDRRKADSSCAGGIVQPQHQPTFERDDHVSKQHSPSVTESRLRTLEERLKHLRVNEEIPNASSRAIYGGVFDRLANPATYTGIHRYAVQRRAASSSSPTPQVDQPAAISRNEKSPVRIKVVLTDNGKAPPIKVEASEPFKTKSGWERVASQTTESYSNKRQLPLRDPSLAFKSSRRSPSTPPYDRFGRSDEASPAAIFSHDSAPSSVSVDDNVLGEGATGKSNVI